MAFLGLPIQNVHIKELCAVAVLSALLPVQSHNWLSAWALPGPKGGESWLKLRPDCQGSNRFHHPITSWCPVRVETTLSATSSSATFLPLFRASNLCRHHRDLLLTGLPNFHKRIPARCQEWCHLTPPTGGGLNSGCQGATSCRYWKLGAVNLLKQIVCVRERLFS